MKKENIFDNQKVTVNNEQLTILKQHFPNCFDADGKFILDAFKSIIKDKNLEFSDESYSLNWLGKSYAQLLRNDKIRTLISPCHEHNTKKENINSNNLLIKGDNLEVLKHLRNAYSGKINVIYIDPPYNTGQDGFVYKDDRQFTVEELTKLAKISDDEAQRILDFTSKGANNHSAWLTFIYPRLYIARDLLSDDGVIFISIDDNEQAQLKLLCDEIFGESNCLGPIIHNKLNSKNDTLNIQKNHDFILVYRKVANYELGKEKASIVDKKQTKRRVFNEEEQFFYLSDPLTTRGDGGTLRTRVNLGYTIYFNPKTKDFLGEMDYDSELIPLNDESKVYTNNQDLINKGYIAIRPPKVRGELGAWTWELDNFNNNKADIYIKKTRNGHTVHRKIPVDSSQVWTENNKYYVTQISDTNINSIIEYSTNKGTTALTELFGKAVFNNPKNLSMLKFLFKLTQRKNDIILDFFAGSGTTGQAVMELNLQDEGTRQFILVQLPETLDVTKSSDKNAYEFCLENNLEPTIFSLTKARLIKASEKIKSEHPNYQGDLAFKIFETLPVPKNYDPHIENLVVEDQIELFDRPELNQTIEDAILTTWTLYDRVPLECKLEPIDLAGYTGKFSLEFNTLYLINKGFGINQIKALLEKIDNVPEFIPNKIIIYGFAFDSKEQRELHEAVRNYSNKKSIDINIIIRYY